MIKIQNMTDVLVYVDCWLIHKIFLINLKTLIFQQKSFLRYSL